MTTTPDYRALFVELAQCATARAHLAGADAGHFHLYSILHQELWAGSQKQFAKRRASYRRYWRELATAATLSGCPWPEAEHLGVDR
jgi:hypothetical protein